MRNSKIDEHTGTSKRKTQDTNESYVDAYTKQLNSVIGFYSSFCNSLMNVTSGLNQNFMYTPFKTSNIDESFVDMGKKYKVDIDLRIDKSTSIMMSATEAYSKQFDTVVEINKKMVEGINTQLSSVVEQNQKFWNDILNTSKKSSSEKDTPDKESATKAKKNPVEAHLLEVISHHAIK